MAINLTNPIYHDETAAREWLEAARWPNGPSCPHCGSVNVARMGGTSGRPGLFHCPDCRGQFTVRTGHVMERSHIPLTKWVLAYQMMAASKKGCSAHQLHRSLGITYNAAWFMAHRIRAAMGLDNPEPMGGPGQTIEADELYQGKKANPQPSKHRRGAPYIKSGKAASKRAILGLVERGGAARAIHLPTVTAKNIGEKLAQHTDRASRLHTDESNLYPGVGMTFVQHETVNHGAKEFARGDVTTNSVEGFFGIFTRGMIGVYQHCSEAHLQRYLDEFSFRYTHRIKLGVDDAQRAELSVRGGEGKRLMWHAPVNDTPTQVLVPDND